MELRNLAYRQTVISEVEAPDLPIEVQDPGSGGEDKAAAFPILNDEINENWAALGCSRVHDEKDGWSTCTQ